MTTHVAPATLLRQLDDEQIAYELIPHRRTETALAEADALGVEARQVAKTIVLTTPTGLVRAVLPASERLDLHKVRDLLGTTHVELATEDVLVGAFPEFELGAVPPIPGLTHDRVLVDVRLCENQFVLVEAGTHEQSLRLRTADLIALETALPADICRG
jgi:Ala-tRNA(Pro) deacylase